MKYQIPFSEKKHTKKNKKHIIIIVIVTIIIKEKYFNMSSAEIFAQSVKRSLGVKKKKKKKKKFSISYLTNGCSIVSM